MKESEFADIDCNDILLNFRDCINPYAFSSKNVPQELDFHNKNESLHYEEAREKDSKLVSNSNFYGNINIVNVANLFFDHTKHRLKVSYNDYSYITNDFYTNHIGELFQLVSYS